MKVRRIRRDEADYPTILNDRLGEAAPACLYTLGDVAILRQPLVGLICSIRCPGSVIIKTFDTIRGLRDAGVAVIGGFHSPMEHECLDILLRGDQPVVLCPAKGLAGLRLNQETRAAIRGNRLLVVSSFDAGVRRTTAAQAIQRNGMVAALSEVLLVPHAAPKGKTWTTVSAALQRDQWVFTFEDAENTSLIRVGARPCDDHQIMQAVGYPHVSPD